MARPHDNDPFIDADGQARIVRGVTIYSASPRLAELAGRVGFETVWLEMEHGPSGFAEIEHQCMAAEAGGAMPTVRVAGGTRENVLRALEVGARIVVVPMVSTAEQARAVVEFGRFPPVGRRGYNTRSRGVRYGLRGTAAEFEAADARTRLFVQIETTEAIDKLADICRVPGLDGVFLGPGDLSASMGISGQMAHPELIRTVVDAIRHARAAGLHAGILIAPGPLLDAALRAGVDLVICGGDIADLAAAWAKLLPTAPSRPAAAVEAAP